MRSRSLFVCLVLLTGCPTSMPVGDAGPDDLTGGDTGANELTQVCAFLEEAEIAALSAEAEADRDSGFSREDGIAGAMQSCVFQVEPALQEDCIACSTAILDQVYGQP